MEKTRQDLPGVVVMPKTGADRISELSQAGHNTAWYDRGANSRLAAPMEPAASCSWFTIYLLDGDYAWTKNQDGTKYEKYRQLRRAVIAPQYYCSCCKARWATYAEAVSHVEVTT